MRNSISSSKSMRGFSSMTGRTPGDGASRSSRSSGVVPVPGSPSRQSRPRRSVIPRISAARTAAYDGAGKTRPGSVVVGNGASPSPKNSTYGVRVLRRFPRRRERRRAAGHAGPTIVDLRAGCATGGRPTCGSRPSVRHPRSHVRRCVGAPERATLRVSLTSLLLAALVAVALLPARVHAEAPSLADASPRARKVRLHVGERQRFAAPPMGGQCCTWQLDGHTTPARALGWDFVPTSAQVGTHRVTLRIEGRAGATERWWAVRVEPPRPPAVVVASPAAPALEVAPHAAVELVPRSLGSARGWS